MPSNNFLSEDIATQSSTGTSATGIDSLGPSDSTDTGSDSIGTLSAEEFGRDSDRNGTGVRATVESDNAITAADILPDHVERMGAEGAALPDDDESDDLADVESIELDVDADDADDDAADATDA